VRNTPKLSLIHLKNTPQVISDGVCITVSLFWNKIITWIIKWKTIHGGGRDSGWWVVVHFQEGLKWRRNLRSYHGVSWRWNEKKIYSFLFLFIYGKLKIVKWMFKKCRFIFLLKILDAILVNFRYYIDCDPKTLRIIDDFFSFMLGNFM